MTFHLMTRTSALILASGLGLGLALAAHAQEGPRPHRPHHGATHHAKHDHGLRLQDLKAKLKLTPAQETAWATFEASMKPVAASAEHPKMEALAKLNAIQRMEERQKMQEAMHKQHSARMSEHLAATKTFYSQLTTEQQATFDKETWSHHVMRSADQKKGPGGEHRGKSENPAVAAPSKG